MTQEQPLSVLLIDDDDNARMMFALVLRRAGHAVTDTGEGRQALDLLRVKPFDVVVTDVIMPDVDGLEIATAVNELQPRARIVAMSGGTGHLEPSFCLKLAAAMGGAATLMKPFSAQELLMAVDGSLETESASVGCTVT